MVVVMTGSPKAVSPTMSPKSTMYPTSSPNVNVDSPSSREQSLISFVGLPPAASPQRVVPLPLMVDELRQQLAIHDSVPMVQAIDRAVELLGLQGQVKDLMLMQRSEACLRALGSPLAGNGLPMAAPVMGSSVMADTVGAGIPVVSAVMVDAEATAAMDSDARALEIALLRERQALQERRRVEREQFEREEREAQQEREERERRRKVLQQEREREMQLEHERELRMEQARQRQQEEERERRQAAERKEAAVQRDRRRVTDQGVGVGMTIGFFAAGPVGMAVGGYIGNKWAKQRIKESR